MSRIQTLYVLALTVKTFMFSNGKAETFACTMQSYNGCWFQARVSSMHLGNYVHLVGPSGTFTSYNTHTSYTAYSNTVFDS